MNKFYKTLCFILCLILILNIKPVVPESSYEGEKEIYNQIEKNYIKPDNSLRLMTYNILSDSIGYDGSPAPLREKEMLRLFKSTKADVIALQEVSDSWFDILSKNRVYKFTAPLYYKFTHSMTNVLYNPKTVQLVRRGAKTYENAHNSLSRKIDWSVFCQVKTNCFFIVINTHLNIFNEESSATLNQAIELISFCEELSDKYPCPIFIMGDFNSKERESISDKTSAPFEYISLLTQNTQLMAKNIFYGPKKTASAPRLDHIFLKGKAQITNYNLLSYSELSHLSDHYPVFTDVILKEN